MKRKEINALSEDLFLTFKLLDASQVGYKIFLSAVRAGNEQFWNCLKLEMTKRSLCRLLIRLDGIKKVNGN